MNFWYYDKDLKQVLEFPTEQEKYEYIQSKEDQI